MNEMNEHCEKGVGWAEHCEKGIGWAISESFGVGEKFYKIILNSKNHESESSEFKTVSKSKNSWLLILRA